MLDPTKVGLEKNREKFGRVFRKGAFEWLHAKKVEFEQGWIREKLDSKKLDSQKVGFEASWIRKELDSKKVKSQKSDSRKSSVGYSEKLHSKGCIRKKMNSNKVGFEKSWIRKVGSWIRNSWIPEVGFDKS